MLVRKVTIKSFDNEKERDLKMKEAKENGLESSKYNFRSHYKTGFDMEYGFKHTVIINSK
ncbi:MAG: hypothetical protein RSC24_06300 [Clostridium sp.]